MRLRRSASLVLCELGEESLHPLLYIGRLLLDSRFRGGLLCHVVLHKGTGAEGTIRFATAPACLCLATVAYLLVVGIS